MKPNFSKMTCQELRAYILANREDDEAIAALINRGNPNRPKFSFPKTDSHLKEMQEILRDKLSHLQFIGLFLVRLIDVFDNSVNAINEVKFF